MCKFWKAGECHRGNDCAFQHPPKPAAASAKDQEDKRGRSKNKKKEKNKGVGHLAGDPTCLRDPKASKRKGENLRQVWLQSA